MTSPMISLTISSMPRLPRVFMLLLTAAWLGFAAPHALTAELVPTGPEVQLSTGHSPQRVVLAVQPAGNYAIAWNDLPSRVFLSTSPTAPSPRTTGRTPLWTGATPERGRRHARRRRASTCSGTS